MIKFIKENWQFFCCTTILLFFGIGCSFCLDVPTVPDKDVPAVQPRSEPTDEELAEFIASPPVVEFGEVYTADHDFYNNIKDKP